MPITHTAQQIAQRVGGVLTGPPDVALTGLAALDEAAPGQLVLIRDARHAARWPASRASAALVVNDVALDPGGVSQNSLVGGRSVIRVANADLALIAVLQLFQPAPVRPRGVHPSAAIDPSAVLGRDVAIGPCCVIGAGARIGDGCILHAHVTVMDEAVLGPACEVFPGVVIRERCELGTKVMIHPNAVIGADGFGFRPAPDGRGLVKIPQIGIVRIGDDVEIGAGTCIDRGTFGATLIGSGTKIDNLCQIAHNCRIGRACAFAAQTGIAGSTVVGDGVLMGGQAAIRDHLTIGAGAQIAACAAVMDDVPPGARWAGYPAMDGRDTMRQVVAMRALPDLMRTVRKLVKGAQDPASGPAPDPGMAPHAPSESAADRT